MAFLRRKPTAQELSIKFTSTGIPYLSEFENVSVRSNSTYSHNPKLFPATGCVAEGLYIRPGARVVEGASSRSRHLRRLQRTIVQAVTAAGMDSPPACEMPNPMDVVNSSASNAGVLFRGTYGQVASALVAAGLTITPCASQGITDATKLGALFVARNDGRSVQFTKLTLWG